MSGRSLAVSVILVVVASLVFGVGAFASQDPCSSDLLVVAWQDGVAPEGNGCDDGDPNGDCDQDRLRLMDPTQDQLRLQLQDQLRDGSCDGSGTGSANGNNGGGSGGSNSGGNGGGNRGGNGG